ncbi:MAG: MBL fold metallo-hydrolase [Lachnospiraceae bacterium]|nr:MBL fold metallo-hydrolase [Lachnospiraceae bacterium]
MPEIVKIDDTTYRIENEFVRFFLLVGNDKAVLIDSGFNCENAKELAESVTKLPLMLVNTHGDGDHTAGTGAFSEIYMTEEDYYGCGVAERFPNTKLVSAKDGDVLELGGRTLKIITIPGHTNGSIAILDVENRRLFAGDSVQNGSIFMFGDKRNPEAFEASLNKLIAMKAEYDTVVASHAEPILEADFVDKVLESWNEVRSSGADYPVIDMHGAKVHDCRGKYCGFFLA